MVAMAFSGYNFECVVASDLMFDFRGWVFGVKLSDEDIAEIAYLGTLPWQPILELH